MIGSIHGSSGSQENSVTYVEFYRMPGGNLLFTYRQGGSGSGYMVLNRWNVTTKTWSRVHTRVVDGSMMNPQHSPYWQLYLDVHGTLHLSWVFRRTSDVRTNAHMYYAYSEDEGVTWRRKSNGSAYTLPITPRTTGNDAAEKVWDIPEDSNLMNQTNMTADKDGNPYILTYFGRPTMQYRVIYHDGTEWKISQVSNRTTNDDAVRNPNGTVPFLSGGGTMRVPIARPRMVTRYNETSGKTEAYFIFRCDERDAKVSMYSTQDISTNVWTVRDLTNFTVNLWEPSHDTELWKNHGKLHLFVQYTDGLGDGGDLNTGAGTPTAEAYCLEVGLD